MSESQEAAASTTTAIDEITKGVEEVSLADVPLANAQETKLVTDPATLTTVDNVDDALRVMNFHRIKAENDIGHMNAELDALASSGLLSDIRVSKLFNEYKANVDNGLKCLDQLHTLQCTLEREESPKKTKILRLLPFAPLVLFYDAKSEAINAAISILNAMEGYKAADVAKKYMIEYILKTGIDMDMECSLLSIFGNDSIKPITKIGTASGIIVMHEREKEIMANQLNSSTEDTTTDDE